MTDEIPPELPVRLEESPFAPEASITEKPILELGAVSVLRRVLMLYFGKWRLYTPFFALTTILPLLLTIGASEWFSTNVEHAPDALLNQAHSHLTRKQLDGVRKQKLSEEGPTQSITITPVDVVIHEARDSAVMDYTTKTFTDSSFWEFGLPLLCIVLFSLVHLVGLEFYRAFYYDRIYLDHNGWHESDNELIRNAAKRNMWIFLFPLCLLILMRVGTFQFDQGLRSNTPPTSRIFVLLAAAIVLFVPLLYLYYRISFTFVAMITEKLSLFDGLRRSWHVSRGYFWWTMYITLVSALPLATIAGLFLAFGMIDITSPFKADTPAFLLSLRLTVFDGLSTGQWMLAFITIPMGVAYVAIKDGIDVVLFSEYARRFDCWQDPVSLAHQDDRIVDFNLARDR